MNTTDRELLEQAAKAAGIVESKGPMHSGLGILIDKAKPTAWSADCRVWNPLADDGDALRLAVKLYIEIRPSAMVATAAASGAWEEEPHNGDPYAATRRAIVRAAAEIGRMKDKE